MALKVAQSVLVCAVLNVLWGLECIYFSALWGPPQENKIAVISGTRMLQVAWLLKSERNPMSCVMSFNLCVLGGRMRTNFSVMWGLNFLQGTNVSPLKRWKYDSMGVCYFNLFPGTLACTFLHSTSPVRWGSRFQGEDFQGWLETFKVVGIFRVLGLVFMGYVDHMWTKSESYI